jgi:hypothetical protein
MLQVSKPVQLLLLLTAVFGAAWFFVLRPKPVDAPASAQTQAAPGQVPGKTGPTGGAAGTGNANTTLGKSVDKAVQGANTASNDAATAAGADPGGTTNSTPAPATATPASPTGATPATAPAPTTAKPKGLPAPVARALAAKKVVVLLFWNPTAADDQAVRKELRSVKTRGAKVYIASAPISQLARYAGITRGVQIVQAPTVVVVDGNRNASTITGYTDAVEINQAVSDALAATKKKPTS